MRARDAILVVACLGACLALASCASSSTPGQAGGSPEHGDGEYVYAGYQQLIEKYR